MNRKLMAFIGLLLLCLVGIAAWFITKAPTDEISQNITIKDVEKLSDEELLGTYVKGWELSMADRNKLAFSQAADIPSDVLLTLFLHSLGVTTDEQYRKYEEVWYGIADQKFHIPITYIKEQLAMFFEDAVFVPDSLSSGNAVYNSIDETISVPFIDGWGSEVLCTLADKKINGNELVLTVNFDDVPLTKIYTIRFGNGQYKYLSVEIKDTADLGLPPLHSDIQDDINQLDNATLERIALSYFNIFGFKMSFAKDDLLDYGKAYQYIKYSGVYRLNHLSIWEMPELMIYHDEKTATLALPAEVVDKLILENRIERSDLAECVVVDDVYFIDDFFWEVRPVLHRYFNKDNWEVTMPAEMVDKYILGKFNTEIDRLQISEYNKASDTYTFEPFLGEFYYDLIIDQVTSEGSVTRFNCTATLSPDVQETPSIPYQAAFTIELFNGQYKYLSVEIKDTEN